jgi:hypothetical protein
MAPTAARLQCNEICSMGYFGVCKSWLSRIMPTSRDSSRRVVGTCGTSAITARSIDHAIRASGRAKPNVVLMDMAVEGTPGEYWWKLMVRECRPSPLRSAVLTPVRLKPSFAASPDR